MDLSKKEINENIVKISKNIDKETFLFSLFNLKKFKQLNNNALFYFNDESIDLFIFESLKNFKDIYVSLLSKNNKKYILVENFKRFFLIKKENVNKKDFLKLAFLFAGTITNINSSNVSIEFLTNDNYEFLVESLKPIVDLKPKLIEKNNSMYVYFKKYKSIVNFFNYVGDYNTAFFFKSKEKQKTLNRNINNEFNNLNKSIEVSNKLITIIENLKKDSNFNKLDNLTKKIIKVKIENPDFSYIEIANFLNKENTLDLNKQKVAYIFSKLKKM